PARAVPPRYTVRLVQPPPARASTFPRGMNQSGEVAGYAADEQYSPQALPILVDSQGQLIPLATAADSFNFAIGVNDTGIVVGHSGFDPFIWIGDSGTPLQRAPGFGSGSANDISNAGRICGSMGDSDFIGPRPCVWLDASQPAALLPAVQTGARNGA